MEDLSTAIVVYTVPHAAPAASDWGRASHMQDTAALSFHDELRRAVRTWNVHQRSFVNQELPRDKVDLNRPAGIQSGFVPDYRKYLQEHRQQVGLVIDVHSFPPMNPPAFGVEADVVLLEHSTSQAITRSLHSHLSQAGVSSAIVQGAECASLSDRPPEQCNALQHYAGAVLGLPALLVEFSERAMTNDERALIVTTIAAFVGAPQD